MVEKIDGSGSELSISFNPWSSVKPRLTLPLQKVSHGELL